MGKTVSGLTDRGGVSVELTQAIDGGRNVSDLQRIAEKTGENLDSVLEQRGLYVTTSMSLAKKPEPGRERDLSGDALALLVELEGERRLLR